MEMKVGARIELVWRNDELTDPLAWKIHRDLAGVAQPAELA